MQTRVLDSRVAFLCAGQCLGEDDHVLPTSQTEFGDTRLQAWISVVCNMALTSELLVKKELNGSGACGGDRTDEAAPVGCLLQPGSIPFMSGVTQTHNMQLFFAVNLV